MTNTLLTLQREAMMAAASFSPRNIRRAAPSRFMAPAFARPRLNANGVPSQSPGLRGTSYPGEKLVLRNLGLEDTIPLGLKQRTTSPRYSATSSNH
jgi:hypothetical protein